jgi:hypothetical protein
MISLADTRATPHTLITRGEENGKTHGTSDHELLVARVHVLSGSLLDLVITVRYGVDKWWVGHGDDAINPVQQREGGAVPHSEWDGVGNGLDVLDIQQSLDTATLLADGLDIATNTIIIDKKE